MVDKSDDDDSSESSDEEQTEVFTAKEYKKYLKSIPAEVLKRFGKLQPRKICQLQQ